MKGIDGERGAVESMGAGEGENKINYYIIREGNGWGKGGRGMDRGGGR